MSRVVTVVNQKRKKWWVMEWRTGSLVWYSTRLGYQFLHPITHHAPALPFPPPLRRRHDLICQNSNRSPQWWRAGTSSSDFPHEMFMSSPKHFPLIDDNDIKYGLSNSIHKDFCF